MTNYEILKECKHCWEYLQDLEENNDYMNENRHIIEKTIDLIEELYTDTWEKMKNDNKEYKQLETNVSDRYGHKMIISDLISYAYLCEECDENMYLFEGDTNYTWWFDDKKDIDYQLEEVVEKKVQHLKNELKYVKERNEVCGTSKRDLTEEDLLTSEIERYEEILSNI